MTTTTIDTQAIINQLTPQRRARNVNLHHRFPQHGPDHFLGIDDEGALFVWSITENMWWRITSCCGASTKGYEDGVFCRACAGYTPDEDNWPVVLEGQDIEMFGPPPAAWNITVPHADA